MKTEPVTLRTDDGWTLRGERLVDARAPVVAVLGHAMMVDRRTLDRPAGAGLASTLHRAGIDVSWLDARGHGESGPRADEGARWSYDDVVRYDVPALVAHGRAIAAGRPVVIVGHSLIGHASMIAAGLVPDRAPDAIVAFAPNLWAPELEPSRARRAVKALTLASWHAVSRARGFFDAPALGMGPASEAEPYVRQFRDMWNARRLAGGGDDYQAAMARARLDVLAFSSEGDRLFAHPASVERFAAHMTASRVEHVRLRGEGAPDHMGFVTDPRSRGLWERAAAWIRARAERA
ncbi:MAG: alpha/beta hydrolase [Sandaracinaceae bacterium]|nr:alpha/beta hydrolase [Sandaracinaceae bacterium]